MMASLNLRAHGVLQSDGMIHTPYYSAVEACDEFRAIKSIKLDANCIMDPEFTFLPWPDGPDLILSLHAASCTPYFTCD